ncbi:SUMO1 sentrin specific peptidase 1 [Geranomyces michiganensis]|nr:SUMO1 sentrin specific peptidase 1 [Geranomyces michiganensis]
MLPAQHRDPYFLDFLFRRYHPYGTPSRDLSITDRETKRSLRGLEKKTADKRNITLMKLIREYMPATWAAAARRTPAPPVHHPGTSPARRWTQSSTAQHPERAELLERIRINIVEGKRLQKVLAPKIFSFYKKQGKNVPKQLTTPVYQSLIEHQLALDEQLEDLKSRMKWSEDEQSGSEELFPPLTDEEDLIIDTALRKPESTILAKNFNMEIRPPDLATLRSGRWLNDEGMLLDLQIINYYGQMILARNKANPDQHSKVHIFNTFFYERLQAAPFYQNVRRWTRKAKIDLFQLDKVIIPLHLGNHWTCGVINLVAKRFEYYDSLGPHSSAQIFSNLRQYVAHEWTDKKGGEFCFDGWTDYAPLDVPRQLNGNDCGVFTSLFMDYAALGKPFDFDGEGMDYWRRRIMFEILQGKLGFSG